MCYGRKRKKKKKIQARKYLMASSRHINLINNGVDSVKIAFTSLLENLKKLFQHFVACDATNQKQTRNKHSTLIYLCFHRKASVARITSRCRLIIFIDNFSLGSFFFLFSAAGIKMRNS